MAHCSLDLLGSGNLSTSASQVARTTGVCHRAQVIFVFFIEMGFYHVAQADHELLSSNNPPASASQNVRITGMNCAWPNTVFHQMPWIMFFFWWGESGSVARLECSGMISAPCNLCLLGPNDSPALASWRAGSIGAATTSS